MLRSPLSLALVLVLPLAPSLLEAQGPPVLVADLATQPIPTLLQPGSGALAIGSVTYFAGFTSEGGTELWKSDGTPQGTTLVRDISPGARGSTPRSFVSLGGVLYFVAESLGHGAELWRSDGTASGTYLVRDISPGEDGSYPARLAVVGSALYFSADHPSHGRELWRSDGTSGGTALVIDVRPGTASGMDLDSEIVAGVRLLGSVSFSAALFVADDGVSGEELWEAGIARTGLRADLDPGSGSSSPRELTSFSGHVLFSATDGSNGREPFYTRNGPVLSAGDLNPGFLPSSPQHIVARSHRGNVEFFFAATRTGYGAELWRYDVGSAATTLIDDLYAGSTGSDPVPFVAGSTVLFSAETPVLGRELWKTDGTTAGTVLVRDIRSRGSSDPSAFFVLSNSPLRVLFAADDGASGEELWVTDGSTAGTRLVVDLHPGGASEPRPLAALPGGRALLGARLDVSTSACLASDGTNAGTLVLLPASSGAASSFPTAFTGDHPGATAWFHANDGLLGSEPFRSDGTGAGTFGLGDLNPGGMGSSLQWAVDLDGRTIFVANGSGLGSELWMSDGTIAGTQLVADIHPGSTGSQPEGLLAMDGFVLFVASDPIHGRELWRSDGTPAGTQLVLDIVPGTSSGVYPTSGAFARRSGELYYFQALTPAHGLELWVSDGTPSGTRLVRDIRPGPLDSLSVASRAEATSTHLLFTASDGTSGIELWRTTGSAASTQLVADLSPGSASSTFFDLCWNGSLLFFSATTSSASGLYSASSSGGLLGLARPFATFPLGAPGLAGLTPLGSKVVFAGFDPSTGFEPWISDGSFGGTNLLRELMPGAESGVPVLPLFGPTFDGFFFAPPNAGVALFAGVSAEHGVELWRTDGTLRGTVLHADLCPGPMSSSPTAMSFAGDRLYFSAFEPTHGREPYVMDPPALTGSYLAGCPGTGGLDPELRASGTPFLGNAGFALRLGQGRPASVASVNVGFDLWNLPLGGGCALLVDLALPYAAFSLLTDGRGDGFVALPLPLDPLLAGLQIFAQGLVVDSGGAFAGALSFTGGWRAILQPQ